MSDSIEELKKSTQSIRLDIKRFEAKYNMTSEDFYHRFKRGHAEDSEDFIIWSGLCEMLLRNQQAIEGLE
jgi:hypothetical protein